MDKSKDNSFVKHHEDRVWNRIDQVASDLRRIADEVERAGKQDRTTPDRAVTSVIHSVAWGVANLNLDGLASSLADWHEAKDAVRALGDAD
jgi:hypothetical protein